MFTLDLKDIYNSGCYEEPYFDFEKAAKIYEQYSKQKEIFVTSSILGKSSTTAPTGMSFDRFPCQPPIMVNEDAELKENVFTNNSKIELVILDDNITSLDKSAFENCINLKEVVMSSEIKYMGDYAFKNCSNLKSLQLSNDDEIPYTIPEGAFQNCTSLEYLYIPEGCQVIWQNAFANCTSLKKIYLPKSLKTIADSAFLGCTNLEEVCGGENIEEIKDFAFFGCRKLTDFPFSIKLSDIADNAFGSSSVSVPYFICTKAESEYNFLSIPNGVKTLLNHSAVNPNGENWLWVELPETVRNIASEAFKSEGSFPFSRWKEILQSLPKEMNMPKRYFRRRTPFDYKMAFLLAKTIWKNYVTFADYEAVILYQNDEFAQQFARDELNSYCEEHLKNLLAHTDNSPIQFEHIACYAAAYVSEINRPLIEKLESRVIRYNAANALSILNKYCLNDVQRELDEDVEFCFRFLEPYKADTCVFLDKPFCVRYKNSNEYVPDIVVKSVFYAYFKQFSSYNLELNINFTPSVKNKYADKLAEKFDRESFSEALDSLINPYTPMSTKYLVLICRYADVDMLETYTDYFKFIRWENPSVKETLLMYLDSALKLNESEGIDEFIEGFKSSRWFNDEETDDNDMYFETGYDEVLNGDGTEYSFDEDEPEYFACTDISCDEDIYDDDSEDEFQEESDYSEYDDSDYCEYEDECECSEYYDESDYGEYEDECYPFEESENIEPDWFYEDDKD